MVKSPMMVRIKSKLTQLYNALKVQISNISASFDEVEMEIKSRFDKLQRELVELRAKHLDELNSLEVGFSHKMDEIVWMEYFIKFQMEKIKPCDYIEKYFTHLTMQDEFLSTISMPDSRDLNVLSTADAR